MQCICLNVNLSIHFKVSYLLKRLWMDSLCLFLCRLSLFVSFLGFWSKQMKEVHTCYIRGNEESIVSDEVRKTGGANHERTLWDMIPWLQGDNEVIEKFQSHSYVKMTDVGTSRAVQWLTLHLLMQVPKTQNTKQRQYCNKFNKDFKNGPHQKIIKIRKNFCSKNGE